MNEQLNNVETLKDMTPQEYFDYVKELKKTATDEELKDCHTAAEALLQKYLKTGQKKGIAKLLFILDSINKERELIRMGIDTYVYRHDVEEYIDSIANDAVKIIDLANYEREIPDDIVDVMEKVKDLFDNFYVVFTDYTGREERKIEKERRSRDPILFGVFESEKYMAISERFYFIGDWEDEYCDLTLDKMVHEVQYAKNKNIKHTAHTPVDLDEVREIVSRYVVKRYTGDDILIEEDKNKPPVEPKKPKKSMFAKVRTWLGVSKG